MARMRRRDIRAIAFCLVTIGGLGPLIYLFTERWLPAAGFTAAYAAWLLTRPRMIRVFRRLRGEHDGWRGYYTD